ncbi:DUF4041 domain-containing protein [Microbacterium sp. STN6]|uniref:DUF4041 domain-containing protein n=1 Tax=Microbacterium sp. STN6 TaxID=2995588 RepID=UPI002260BFE0|nr:DUF4041 domain-containing protein [Microbacterium sp. STN6]MCX7523435.1 DUF4041 domain-containing protein [Microbacterium sp. STN6]
MSAGANWYENPDDPTTIRYWDGSAWTDQIRPKVGASSAPAGWYPDAERPGGERWWDGASWTTKRTLPEAAAPHKAEKPIERLSKADARHLATELTAKVAELQSIIDKHGLRSFADIDAYRAEQEAQLADERGRAEAATMAAQSAANLTLATTESRLAEVQRQLDQAQQQLDEINRQRADVTDVVSLQEVGLFDYEHPAQSSAALATELESIRSRIKNLVREKRAVTTTNGFTFNNSAAQGKKFINDMTKVLLRAYNAEAENAVKATKAGNLYSAQTRLTRAAEQIANGGKMIQLRVTDEYHRLRLKELELANTHLMALQRERELERERRAELREQQKAEAELRREKERLEKERAHYVSTLTALEANGDAEGADRIRSQLSDVERAINDVDYRAANIRAGHVYVISNIGAFGENIVKIGMTRRLEPMERVNELGDASVPFRFDVHALFFATDAVGIESYLHKRFAEQRVNRVNLRREFFRVTPAQVLEALKEQAVEVVEFTTEPAAPEYRASTGMPALHSA